MRQIFDASAMVVGSSRYDPFGNVMSQGGAKSVFAFAGEQYDAATGLTYLRARYYSAAQGRFTTRDVWEGEYQQPQTLDAWVYGTNNPVRYADPTGHQNDDSETIRADLYVKYDVIVSSIRQFYLEKDLKNIQSVYYRFQDLAGGQEQTRRYIGSLEFLPSSNGARAFNDGVYMDRGHLDHPLAKVYIMHELAHIWDFRTSTLGALGVAGKLVRGLACAVPASSGPTIYAREHGPVEDWAESVAMFVYPEYKDYLFANAPGETANGNQLGLEPFHWTYVYMQFQSLRTGGK